VTGEALEVVILGKEGCHLCEVVEAEIRSMKESKAKLTVIDIDRNPALQAKYWLRIPVVTVGGKDIFEAKMIDPEGRWRIWLPSLLRVS
jgi:CO dehydrogenase nickel-insertion accessory protein CooC1